MKKMLLAGIAALSVLYASAASAQEPKVELPDSMVGLWCYAKDISTDTEDHYLEPYGDDGDENCGDGIFDRIKIWKDDDGSSGYSLDWFLPGWHSHCTFERVEVISPTVALVHASCHSGLGRDPITSKEVKPPWTENLELRVIEGELVITELPEG
jgi:hypothetical protein